MSIISLPTQKAQEAEVLLKGLQTMRDNLAVHLEYIEITGQIARKKYEVLVANGFTEAQALEMLKGTL